MSNLSTVQARQIEWAEYYQRTKFEARPYEPGEDISSILGEETAKYGDMIVRKPNDPTFTWIVRKDRFAKLFERVLNIPKEITVNA